MANSTDKAGLSLGPIYLSSQQIIVGIVVELFALIPSLLIVQLFRRIRTRRASISPLKAALSKIRSTAALYVNLRINLIDIDLFSRKIADQKSKKSSFTLPWWWILITYGLCVIFVGISMFFIIARGIEFGDMKSQQWLASILSGFFSSIFLTQPLKVRIEELFDLNCLSMKDSWFGNLFRIFLSKIK